MHIPGIFSGSSDYVQFSYMQADDDDALGWELAQLQKLKLIAEAYGWDEDDPKYKAKLKQVQALGKQRLADTLKGKGGRGGKSQAIKWVTVGEIKAKTYDEAKAGLQDIWKGVWVPDRRCAQSTTGGMTVRRFKSMDKATGTLYLGRIIDLQGGKYKLQSGGVDEPAEEKKSEEDAGSTADDDDDDEPPPEEPVAEEPPTAPARRGTTRPSASSAKRAASTEEPAKPAGKAARRK